MFFLQLRSELWKLFGKKRTYLGFGVFLVAQNLVLMGLYFSKWRNLTIRMLDGNGFFGQEYITALTVALIMLIPQIALLMPLYVTLIGGDIVAKEAEEGTLRMILARPISRTRLLLVKWIAGVIFAGTLVASLGAMALFFARLWFPWGGMFVFIPGPVRVFSVLTADVGFQYYCIAHVYLVLNACTMLSLAFMFSCFNVKPAAATIVALSVLFVFTVMEQLPFFEDYKDFMVTYHLKSWVLVFARPIPWAQMVESFCVLAGINVTVFIIGATHFNLRDIKS
mgnify:CR=1 FL=1